MQHIVGTGDGSSECQKTDISVPGLLSYKATQVTKPPLDVDSERHSLYFGWVTAK